MDRTMKNDYHKSWGYKAVEVYGMTGCEYGKRTLLCGVLSRHFLLKGNR